MKTNPRRTITALLALIAFAAVPLTAFAQDSTIQTWRVYAYNGVPGNGTSEIDTLTIQTGTTSGTFTITVSGARTTAPITWSATNATLVANVDAALEATPTIGVGGCTTAVGTMTAGIGTITITMTGKNAKRDFPLLGIGTNSLVGGAAPTLTTTTAGVDATFRDAATGTLLVDTSTPDLYINDSTTAGSPTWTKVSP
jgi:phage tail sheath gpL-like